MTIQIVKYSKYSPIPGLWSSAVELANKNDTLAYKVELKRNGIGSTMICVVSEENANEECFLELAEKWMVELDLHPEKLPDLIPVKIL